MNLRDMQNDLWRFSLSSGNSSKIYCQNLSQLSRRMFSTGFLISQFFFSVGGISSSGETIPEITMIDLEKHVCKTLTKESNKSMRLLKPLSCMSCVDAFYSSRYSKDEISLDLDQVSREIDWSTALSLIKYEGIYCFGGKDANNMASNRLFCI